MSGIGNFQQQPRWAVSFAVAGGAISAGSYKGRDMIQPTRTAAGVYTCTLGNGGVDDTDMIGGVCGSFVGAVGAILDFVSTSDTVKVVRFFDNAGAAIEPITVRIWFNQLLAG